MRWKGVVGALVLAACAGVGGVVAGPFGDDPGEDKAAGTVPTGLATVTRGRLSARTSVDGTLAYAGGYQAVNQATGIYTNLPRTGRVIRQGQVLYRVGGEPVVLLKGSSTPSHRDLRQGMSGPDVRQLNAALVALDYATRAELNPRSRHFGRATACALKELQDDLGLTETGTLPKGQAVFLPRDRVRITKVNATAGAPAQPGETVLEAGSTTRRVTVELEASLQSRVKAGDKVTITLPDLRTTPGTVTSVGTVARKDSNGKSTVRVTIKPSDSTATGGLDQAPVGVSIVTESVDDALSVPVIALLALPDGGYGIEVAEADGTRRLVPVTLGLFDHTAGTVQISGDGVTAGRRVVVPAS